MQFARRGHETQRLDVMQLLLLSDPAVVSSRHSSLPLCSFRCIKKKKLSDSILLDVVITRGNVERRLRRRCIGAQLRIGPRCCRPLEISPVCGHASCAWRVTADYIIVLPCSRHPSRHSCTERVTPRTNGTLTCVLSAAFYPPALFSCELQTIQFCHSREKADG